MAKTNAMRKIAFLFLIALSLTSCAVTQDSNDFVFPSRMGKQLYLRSYNNAMRLWDVKYEEANVPTQYGVAHVLIAGPRNAPAVALFHGTDASSTMWYPNIEALSKRHRVYAIDYPLETGKSLAYVRNMDPNDMIRFYNEVFAHFKLDQVSIVAASRGGWVATLLALEPQNRVDKLVLLSPAQTFGSVDHLFKAMSALKLKMFPSMPQLNRFFKQFSNHPEKIDHKYKEQFYLANKFGRSKPDLMKMYRFSKEKLQGLQIPVLVLVGDHDVINDTAILDRAKAQIPHAETAIIPDAGHFISIDQASLVNKLMTDFLDQPHADTQLPSLSSLAKPATELEKTTN